MGNQQSSSTLSSARSRSFSSSEGGNSFDSYHLKNGSVSCRNSPVSSTLSKRSSQSDSSLRTYHLAPELWHHVFSYKITPETLYRMQLVCKDWYQMLTNAYLSLDCSNNKSINDNRLFRLLMPLQKIQQLNLSSCNALEGESLKELKGLSQLKVLKICHSHLSQRGFRNVLALSSLIVLNLACTNLSYKRDWDRIVFLTRLEVLDLTNCKIPNEALSFIGSLPSLRELYLENCNDVRDDGVVCLTSLKLLEVLDLINCSKVTDQSICVLTTTLSNLQQFYLLRCSKLTDIAINAISFLPRLRKLDLGKCRGLTNDAFKSFSKLTTLTSLSLFKCSSIDDLGFGLLTTLTSIYALDIGYTNISPVSQTHLTKMSRLRYLYAENCPIFALDTSVFHLLTNIVELHISFLNDHSVTNLKLLNELEKLHLNGGSVSDIGLENSLSSLTRLKELNFVSLDSITNQGMKVVAQLTSLQNFSLIGCQKITVSGVTYLSSLRQLRHLFINNPNIAANKMQVLKLYLTLPINVKITIIDQ